jgi:hypothetical protein
MGDMVLCFILISEFQTFLSLDFLLKFDIVKMLIII